MSVRISVITASLNRRNLLQRAIESVLAQRGTAIEHIIVDGVSTDGTLEMLAVYPHLIVISEPDRNVYEAWNKGLRRMTGDLLCFLNSDDEIPPGAFAQASAALAADPGLDMISGPVEIRRCDPVVGIETRLIDDARILELREQDVGPGITLTNGRYLTPRLVARVGYFDERYRLVSDRDYLLRVLLAAPRKVVVTTPLYRYYVHEGSLTLAGAGTMLPVSVESLAAARNGLAEATLRGTRLAYARWHAWASLYMAGLEARAFHWAAAAVAAESFRRDPIWPLRASAPIVRHIRERAARRGRRISEGSGPGQRWL